MLPRAIVLLKRSAGTYRWCAPLTSCLFGCSEDGRDALVDASAEQAADAALDGRTAEMDAPSELDSAAGSDAESEAGKLDGAIPDGAAEPHCTPGRRVEDYAEWSSSAIVNPSQPDHLRGCWNDQRMGSWFNSAVAAGVTCQLDGRDCLAIGNLPLAVPMTAGTPYALSVEYRFSGAENRWQLELWGTNADCGRDSTATLLASAFFKNGHHAACFDALPSATYSHLMLVESDATPGVELGRVTMSYYRLPATFCPGGMCPQP